MDLPGNNTDGYCYINLLDVESSVNMYLSRRRQAPEQGYFHTYPQISKSDTIMFILRVGLETLRSDMDHSYTESIKEGW